MNAQTLTRLPERNLDVLRAVAVSCVVGFHLAMSVTGSATGLDWIGRAGVLLFFVHTSLVLMGSLERTGQEPSWVGRFYLRRAARIYPLAIVAILAVVALHVPSSVPVFGRPNAAAVPSLRAIVANLGLVQNLTADENLLTVLWSLPIEVQMYALLPLCYLVARRGLQSTVAVLVGAIAVCGLWVALKDHTPGLARLSVLGFGPCFLSGVLAYAGVRSVRPQYRAAWWLPLLLAALGVYWAIGYAPFPAQWVLCIVVGSMIPLVAELPESVLTRGAAVVAKYSYGIYLLHVPAMRLAFAISRTAPVAVMLALALTAALSWLAFHLVERPGIELGKRLVARPIPPQPAAIAA